MVDFHVFLSYTSREAEVKLIQPLVDRYCRELWKWADRNGVHVFYDHFSMPQREYSDSELEEILAQHVRDSELMTSFLSPGYIASRWCLFEAVTKALEPDPVIHAIYWKPYTLRYAGVFPKRKIKNPEKLFRKYVKRLKWTDVTYAHRRPSRIVHAALECARDSAEIISSSYPKLFKHPFLPYRSPW